MQMQAEHNDEITTSGHSSLEKYTSHFIERVVCERELETEQRLQHIDPHSSGYHSLSFPFSWATQPGGWGGAASAGTCSHSNIFSNWSELQLTQSEVLRAPSAGC